MELPRLLRSARLPNLTAWLVALTLLLMPGKLAAADGSAPERMRILYASTATSFAPIWITSDLGIYRKHGLDAEAVLLGGGPLIGSVLLSNSADVGWASARRRYASPYKAAT